MLFIPILGLIYLYATGPFKEYRMISISWYDPRYWGPIPHRNYKKFVMADNSQENKELLLAIKRKALKILKQNDTLNGIHIEFAKSAKYEYLIRSIDIINEGCGIWAGEKNNIWMLNRPQVETNNLILPVMLT